MSQLSDKLASVDPKYVEEIFLRAKISLQSVDLANISLGNLVPLLPSLVQKAQTFSDISGPQKAAVVLEGLLQALPESVRSTLEAPLRDMLPAVLTLAVDAAKGKFSLEQAAAVGSVCLPTLYKTLQRFFPCAAKKVEVAAVSVGLDVRSPDEKTSK